MGVCFLHGKIFYHIFVSHINDVLSRWYDSSPQNRGIFCAQMVFLSTVVRNMLIRILNCFERRRKSHVSSFAINRNAATYRFAPPGYESNIEGVFSSKINTFSDRWREVIWWRYFALKILPLHSDVQPPPVQHGAVAEIQGATLHDAILTGGLELHH